MTFPVHSSASSSLYPIQQSQSNGIATTPESENSGTHLPSRNSYNPGEVPNDKKSADRTIHPQTEDNVLARLTISESPTILDSPPLIPAQRVSTTSAYDADISDSELEDRQHVLHSSQAEPSPEAEAAASNSSTKSTPAGKVTFIIGSDPELAGTAVTSENPATSNRLPQSPFEDSQSDKGRSSGILNLFRSCCGIRDRRTTLPAPGSAT